MKLAGNENRHSQHVLMSGFIPCKRDRLTGGEKIEHVDLGRGGEGGGLVAC